jgi:hypothetical protein
MRYLAAVWRKALVAVFAVMVVGLLGTEDLNSPWGRVRADGCPIVPSTPHFTIVYGSVAINNQAAAVGTVVEARTPRGEVAGCFVVETAGHYGMMYIYGEDRNVIPPLPGMQEGEAVTFLVNGLEATPSSVLEWSNDHDMHAVGIGLDARFIYLPFVLRGFS